MKLVLRIRTLQDPADWTPVLSVTWFNIQSFMSFIWMLIRILCIFNEHKKIVYMILREEMFVCKQRKSLDVQPGNTSPESQIVVCNLVNCRHN